MTYVTAESAKTTTEMNASEKLDHRFGQIGISAVAAAARYHGVAKNTAYAPSQPNWDYPNEAA